MQAKFESICSHCGKPIRKGDEISGRPACHTVCADDEMTGDWLATDTVVRRDTPALPGDVIHVAGSEEEFWSVRGVRRKHKDRRTTYWLYCRPATDGESAHLRASHNVLRRQFPRLRLCQIWDAAWSSPLRVAVPAGRSMPLDPKYAQRECLILVDGHVFACLDGAAAPCNVHASEVESLWLEAWS